jgi:hypothetical protein
VQSGYTVECGLMLAIIQVVAENSSSVLRLLSTHECILVKSRICVRGVARYVKLHVLPLESRNANPFLAL